MFHILHTKNLEDMKYHIKKILNKNTNAKLKIIIKIDNILKLKNLISLDMFNNKGRIKF